MMRPVYRWKSFWFGMLVVGFLGWGWVRSMGHYDTMGVGIGDSSWSFEVTGGCVEIERESAAGAYGWIRFFEIDSGEFGWGGRPWFPPAIERFNRGLVLRRQFVEGVEGDPPDPFADPDEDPELARAEREELADLQYEVSDYMTWRIAWWFLVLVFVAPWGAFLAWRWMRMKRPATGSAEVERSGSSPGHFISPDKLRPAEAPSDSVLRSCPYRLAGNFIRDPCSLSDSCFFLKSSSKGASPQQGCWHRAAAGPHAVRVSLLRPAGYGRAGRRLGRRC